MKTLYILDVHTDLYPVYTHLLEPQFNLKIEDNPDKAVPDILLIKPHLVIIDEWSAGAYLSSISSFLRSPDQSLPFVLLSTSPFVAKTASLLSANHFFSKPFDIFEFKEVVTEVVCGNGTSR